jgi:YfiH family protein
MQPRVLQSKLLRDHGLVHGFSTRLGGVSEGAWQSMNLGRSVGDDLAKVEHNYELFANALGYEAGRLFEVSQVHGTEMVCVRHGQDPRQVRACEADAIMTADVGLPIGIRVADCIPMLVANASGQGVAAVHIGWRGAAAGMAPRVVEHAMREWSARPEALICAVGPHIRACCFEVGDDVARQLVQSVPAPQHLPRLQHLVRDRVTQGTCHVSLIDVVTAQLCEVGVPVENIDDLGMCTSCDPTLFFSYRRDGGNTGRHLAVIARPVGAT